MPFTTDEARYILAAVKGIKLIGDYRYRDIPNGRSIVGVGLNGETVVRRLTQTHVAVPA